MPPRRCSSSQRAVQPELRKSLSGATSITEMGSPGPHLDAGPQSLSPTALPCNAQDVPDQHEAEPPASPGLDDFDALDWEMGTASDPDSEPESRGWVKTRSGKRGRKGCVKARRSNGIAANMSLESLETGGYFDMTMQASGASCKRAVRCMACAAVPMLCLPRQVCWHAQLQEAWLHQAGQLHGQTHAARLGCQLIQDAADQQRSWPLHVSPSPPYTAAVSVPARLITRAHS